MGTGDDDRRQALAAELEGIDAERDDLLFRLRMERRTSQEGDDEPSPLRLRYEELEARRKVVRAELRALRQAEPPPPDRQSSP